MFVSMYVFIFINNFSRIEFRFNWKYKSSGEKSLKNTHFSEGYEDTKLEETRGCATSICLFWFDCS